MKIYKRIFSSINKILIQPTLLLIIRILIIITHLYMILLILDFFFIRKYWDKQLCESIKNENKKISCW